MQQIELKTFENAIGILKSNRNRLRDVVIHATMLHMVYGVPISDAVRHTGRASNDEVVNRNSVYTLADKVLKAVEFAKEVK